MRQEMQGLHRQRGIDSDSVVYSLLLDSSAGRHTDHSMPVHHSRVEPTRRQMQQGQQGRGDSFEGKRIDA